MNVTADETAVESFVQAARDFGRWAAEATTSGIIAATEARDLVAQLYSAGCKLKLPAAERLAEEEGDAVEKAEWQQVYDRAANRLPFQYYTESGDSLEVLSDQTMIGDLADDIADMYRDVVGGLRLHVRGETNQAVWAWAFNRQHHWGEHATSCLHALQKYLDRHDFFCA